VSYNARSQSNGTFSASIVLTNTGSAALSNWSLTFSFPNGQTISQMFNGNFTQSGSKVTITSGNLNKTIAAGGKTTITFNGTWSGTNNPPTSFKLNGTTCSTS
jgi:cellulase/cellobiase CelA1